MGRTPSLAFSPLLIGAVVETLGHILPSNAPEMAFSPLLIGAVVETEHWRREVSARCTAFQSPFNRGSG